MQILVWGCKYISMRSNEQEVIMYKSSGNYTLGDSKTLQNILFNWNKTFFSVKETSSNIYLRQSVKEQVIPIIKDKASIL